MKLPSNTNCITVGKLVKELTKLKKEYSDSNVVCILPDDRYCCVTGMIPDKDKNLEIMIEEEDVDGGYYDVDMLLFELDSYQSNTKVYLAGCGLYLTIVTYKESDTFSYDEFDDFVGCESSIFGEYDDSDDDNYSYEQHLVYKANKKRRLESLAESIVLFILTILLAIGFVYNIIAAFKTVWPAVLEHIVWSIVCLGLFVICALTLYNESRD